MTTHAMIDIETLGTKPDAVVLTVGGVKFDPYNSEEPHTPFSVRLDIDEQTAAGRVIDPNTIEWWGQQDKAIQDEAFSEENRTPVMTFIADLNKWLVGTDLKWAQGSRFDYGILEDLIENSFKQHKNWAYWQEADSRTLGQLVPRDMRKDDSGAQKDLHSALADAYNQAKAVQKAYKHLNISQ
jgi:hypothetical protein